MTIALFKIIKDTKKYSEALWNDQQRSGDLFSTIRRNSFMIIKNLREKQKHLGK